MQNRTVEQIVDVSILPIQEEIVEVIQSIPQERISTGIVGHSRSILLSSLGWPWLALDYEAQRPTEFVVQGWRHPNFSWSLTRMALSSRVMVAPQSLGIRLATSSRGIQSPLGT